MSLAEQRPRESRWFGPVAPADFFDWRHDSRSFSTMAAYMIFIREGAVLARGTDWAVLHMVLISRRTPELQRSVDGDIEINPTRTLYDLGKNRIEVHDDYLRFGALVNRLRTARTRVSWAMLAAECGYFDQSHFTRDFKQFAGKTPTEYARGMRELRESLRTGDVVFLQSR